MVIHAIVAVHQVAIHFGQAKDLSLSLRSQERVKTSSREHAPQIQVMCPLYSSGHVQSSSQISCYCHMQVQENISLPTKVSNKVQPCSGLAKPQHQAHQRPHIDQVNHIKDTCTASKMAEPQPPNFQEGADPPDVLPANAEDRKAAAAMSSLESANVESATVPKKEVDVKALTDAMKMLEAGSGGISSKRKETKKKEEEKKEVLIKVDAADVNFVMDQCDMSKVKATDLLRQHEADVSKALMAWVTTAV